MARIATATPANYASVSMPRVYNLQYPGDALTATASVAGATSYNVKRSLTSGGTYATIAAGVTTSSYMDSGLTNGTIYYYVVSAVNANGESGSSNQASATPAAQFTLYQIDSAGGAVGTFVADTDFTGGTATIVTQAVSTAGVANAAPMAVYQSRRTGNFSYNLPGLTSGASYTVRLHFAEVYYTAAGQRTFNVAINGTTALDRKSVV